MGKFHLFYDKACRLPEDQQQLVAKMWSQEACVSKRDGLKAVWRYRAVLKEMVEKLYERIGLSMTVYPASLCDLVLYPTDYAKAPVQSCD